MLNKGCNLQLNETPVLRHYFFLLSLLSHTSNRLVLVFTSLCSS